MAAGLSSSYTISSWIETPNRTAFRFVESVPITSDSRIINPTWEVLASAVTAGFFGSHGTFRRTETRVVEPLGTSSGFVLNIPGTGVIGIVSPVVLSGEYFTTVPSAPTASFLC